MTRIETTGEAELDAFVELLESLGRWLWERDIPQWEPGTQRRLKPLFAHWLRTGILLVARDDAGLTAGCIVSRSAVDGWADDPAEAAYLYKLGVARRAAGRGLGDAVIEAAAGWARERGLPRLRLDCWDGNTVLRSYYRARGFAELAAVPAQGFHVRLFERRL